MASALFKTMVAANLFEAGETLRTQLLGAMNEWPEGTLDFANMTFFATNVSPEEFVLANIGTEAGQNGLTNPDAAKQAGGFIFVQNSKQEVTATDGKVYKVPSKVVLIQTPSVESVIGDKGAAAMKFVRNAIKLALGANARGMVNAFNNKGVALSSDASRFTVTKEQGNPEKAFDQMWANIRDTLVASAAGNARTAAVINSKTVTKDNVKASFESQAAASAIYGGAIRGEHWDALITMCAKLAPEFTKMVPVKGADGKALKQIDEASGKEVTVKEERAVPLSAVYFEHCLSTRHEVVTAVDMPELESLDFSGMGGDANTVIPVAQEAAPAEVAQAS